MSSEDRLDAETVRATGDPLGLLFVDNSAAAADDSLDEKTGQRRSNHSKKKKKKKRLGDNDNDDDDDERGPKLRVDYDKLWALQHEFALAHVLPEGKRVLRAEGNAIYQFEVFRAPWAQEDLRVPYRVDWKARQEWRQTHEEDRKAIKDSATVMASQQHAAAKQMKRSLANERRRRHRLAEAEPRLRHLLEALRPLAAALEMKTMMTTKTTAASPRSPRDEDRRRVAELGELVARLQRDQSTEVELLADGDSLCARFQALAAAADAARSKGLDVEEDYDNEADWKEDDEAGRAGRGDEEDEKELLGSGGGEGGGGGRGGGGDGGGHSTAGGDADNYEEFNDSYDANDNQATAPTRSQKQPTQKQQAEADDDADGYNGFVEDDNKEAGGGRGGGGGGGDDDDGYGDFEEDDDEPSSKAAVLAASGRGTTAVAPTTGRAGSGTAQGKKGIGVGGGGGGGGAVVAKKKQDDEDDFEEMEDDVDYGDDDVNVGAGRAGGRGSGRGVNDDMVVDDADDVVDDVVDDDDGYD